MKSEQEAVVMNIKLTRTLCILVLGVVCMVAGIIIISNGQIEY